MIHQIRLGMKLNQADFAAALGTNQSTISRWESGAMPEFPMLDKIAKLAGIDVRELIGNDIDPAPVGPRLFIKGEVAAGVWKSAFENDVDQWETFMGGSHINEPATARFALRVVGESMNLVYPPDTILDCVHLINGGIHDVENGSRVIVIRRKTTGEIEATVKEYMKNDEGTWLIPRSSNPSFQQPIRIGDKYDDVDEISIVAIVRGSYKPE